MIQITQWVIVGVVCSALYLFFHEDTPIIDLDGDSVVPQQVLAGGAISVYRSFRFTRDESVTVTRLMVRGDCAKSCEFLDLAQSAHLLKAGDYWNVRREHVIPLQASPGKWSLQFTWQWRDAIGRHHKLALAPLEIEVTDGH